MEFDNPCMVPCDLVSRSMLDSLMKVGQIPLSEVCKIDSGDWPKLTAINGQLTLTACHVLPWGISGPLFEKWRTTLKYERIDDEGRYDHGLSIAYFDYYKLYPLE